MSKKSAMSLIERMKTDALFRQRIMTVESVTARIELAREEGFDCSLEDISALRAELAESEALAQAYTYCSSKMDCDNLDCA
jgi:predicted ribosomally synthesized peptide with nif11-like leader